MYKIFSRSGPDALPMPTRNITARTYPRKIVIRDKRIPLFFFRISQSDETRGRIANHAGKDLLPISCGPITKNTPTSKSNPAGTIMLIGQRRRLDEVMCAAEFIFFPNVVWSHKILI